MKIILPGGSGQVGTILSRALHAEGCEVVVLSRNPVNKPWRVVKWDGEQIGDWVQDFEGADAVINLAGRSVNCRYNDENKRAILESRLRSTQVVGEALATVRNGPKVWLQASTATIYAHRYDAPNDEENGIIDGSPMEAPQDWKFSVQVAKAWEQAVDEAEVPGVRKVKLRSAMTMSPDRGGIFDTLLRLVRFGLGGKVGDGEQYVSWIHEQDFVAALKWILAHEELEGPVNVASPNPLPYKDFMAALRKAYGIPFGLPATRWMLEIGAFVLGTESELVLKSRRVVPRKLLRSGFRFEQPTWPEAAVNLCRRWEQGLPRRAEWPSTPHRQIEEDLA
jgi:hypothetical protein